MVYLPQRYSLIGIPGTGKSLTAKMIGGLWRLPLIRLDVGAYMAAWSVSRKNAPAEPYTWPRPLLLALSGLMRLRKRLPMAAWIAAPAPAFSRRF